MSVTCVWTGISGINYTYYVYPLPRAFAPNEDGNYIYTKLAEGKYHPIYIGEGCLSDRCSDQHHKATHIAARGATHIHAHLNSIEANRKYEESDLLEAYTQAYTPIGCNEKIGG
jgi:hypothetical protein